MLKHADINIFVKSILVITVTYGAMCMLTQKRAFLLGALLFIAAVSAFLLFLNLKPLYHGAKPESEEINRPKNRILIFDGRLSVIDGTNLKTDYMGFQKIAKKPDTPLSVDTDGRYLYFTERKILYRYDLMKGTTKKLSDLSGINSVVSISISPEGEKLGMLAAVEKGKNAYALQLSVFDLRSGSITIYPYRAHYGNPSFGWLDRNNLLFVFDGGGSGSAVYALNTATEKARILFGGTDEQVISFSVPPNRRYIVTFKRNTRILKLKDLDGIFSDQILYTFSKPDELGLEPNYISWSLKSDKLARIFSERNHSQNTAVYLADLKNKFIARLILNEGITPVSCALSPKGELLLLAGYE
jgi:dipeptidyl aminopeptidase/acylaminoacyl peptidase